MLYRYRDLIINLDHVILVTKVKHCLYFHVTKQVYEVLPVHQRGGHCYIQIQYTSVEEAEQEFDKISGRR